ncbi:ATP-binding protein [Shewanella inventionis]|uniref:YobI family P-loop NTPase n=1 Tax=Shewanella TaxID=22 RepID=UPI0017832170|nr:MULTISPECIES: ATP-binding protein [Shewanella]MBO1898467.1 ATP-binding protein [Shewanella sp. BF02_Schw]UAL43689.1 ATP-binding protein [Shewanella inventionis]
MIKIPTSFIKLLSNWLSYIISWLESFDHSYKNKSKYVDLAPTDEADKAGVYSEAILYATNNAKVFNIALTGPYGSGKSSIIQSFLKKYRRPALQISLASFVPEADSVGDKVSRQEIERSILQQILYGADANKLPLSRFKRIQSPGVWSFLKSFYIMLGILALWYVFRQREDIISGKFFVPFELSNWFHMGIFLLAATFLWATLHHFYVASFGLSLKSISLKDVEIKPASDDQASILNRHLDEIVYFFQSTKYDLVIIEDLDRFNNADIFVTLREINNLVNENAGVKRTIRFLYALRDDMFVNTERTKFFEFIIPVIPIINASNSIDMVLDEGRRLELDGSLERQFLREVSRYLNDLRLIRNIFNEYAIYVANLETTGENLLDANKLLALLIYKNVYPSDFEQLHRGEGNLAKILNLKDELIKPAEVTYRTEITGLEEQLEIAERQTPSDLRELRQIYAMALIEKLPANANRVSHDQQTWSLLPQLVSHDAFEKLFETSSLFYRSEYSHQGQFDASKLQREVDTQRSYLQRKVEIESKEADNKNKSLRRISELRSKIATLRTTKLNELLRFNPNSLQDHFVTFGENGELARFLLLEGHIDDSYYQYTSLFHSGRLSPNDNKFLIQIRAFVTPDPDFPIDNPQEVIAAMRNEDFSQSYVLNVKLVDSLLSDSNSYCAQLQKLFLYISSKFENCEDFFDAYYTSGSDVAGLISGLTNTWDGLIPAVITSPNNIIHVTQLLANLSENSLKKLAKDFVELPEFVSANLPSILVNSPELTPERLVHLNFEVKDLDSIKEHSEIVRMMFGKGLFALTMANLEYVWQAILGESDLEPLRTRNFSAIRSTNNVTLMKRIERDFDCYFTNILLELEENSNENTSAILEVIQCDTFEQDDIQVFLARQTTQLPALEVVPERLHSMLFQLGTLEPTWANCLTFIDSKMFEPNSLIGYLDRDAVRKVILEQPMPSDSASLKLRLFLVNSSSLSDVAYREYAHALPNPFKNPPNELEPNKLSILIDEGKIAFTKESLDALADYSDLQVLFVAANIDIYLKDPDNFSLDDYFLEELLRSQIDIVDKLRIVELMDLKSLESLPKRSALIGPIIDNADGKISNLNGSIMQSLIRYSSPIATQISLFNKYHFLMTDSEVRNVLVNLPKPFSEIKTGYNTPRLQNTLENKDLVRWLDSKNIISSWKEDFFTDDIRVNLYRR